MERYGLSLLQYVYVPLIDGQNFYAVSITKYARFLNI